MEADWQTNFVRLVIMEMLRKKGYSKVEDHALRILSDLIISLLRKMMTHTKELSNLSSRAESNIQDILVTFQKFGIKPDALINFIKQKKQRNKKRNLSNEIMDTLSKREHFSCREGMGDLNRNTQNGMMKKVKVRSSYPIRFSRPDKERPLSLTIERPPEFYYKDSKNKAKPEMKSSDIKDLKAEEKRIFEIENCNISAIADESKIEKVSKKEKLYRGSNPYEGGSKGLENIGIFDISNNQMF